MIDNRLNILALRDVVIFPGVVSSLLVGRDLSVQAIEDANQNKQDVVLLLQKSSSQESITEDNLYDVGVVAKILQIIVLANNSIKILVEVKHRVKISNIISKPFLNAEVEALQSEEVSKIQNDVYLKNTKDVFEKYITISQNVSKGTQTILSSLKSASRYLDMVMEYLNLSLEEKQEYLETFSVLERSKKVIDKINKEIDWLEVENELRKSIKDDIEEDKASYVREKKLKALQKIIGPKAANDSDNIDDLEKRLQKLPIDKSVKSRLLGDFSKLKSMSPVSAEAMVIRSHLEWVVDIPWNKHSKVNTKLNLAKEILDRDHFGLSDIKQRILEHLAVHIRSKQANSGAILCFVGPPGVGKTSLGKSIAEAMGRKYVRIALGGVRDEAEIRGHRKTYIGAMPGRIIKAMKRSEVVNPLILLDEVDKLGMDFRGDPASALLEVLDPEQNKHFNDHYLEIDYDLSKVVFIATANTLDIPDALLDRMEVINLTGYTEEEKLKIAQKYLLPKSIEKSGLKENEISVSDKAILEVIRGYTKEAGVRAVEKCLAKLCRKVVYELVKNEKNKKAKSSITVNNLKKYLGPIKFEDDLAFTEDKVGLVNGMAWTSVGGVLLTIEALSVYGKGEFKYTGSLGDVMQESMQAALTVVKSRAEFFAIDLEKLSKIDIHVHVPEGATQKDGPSAGAAICVAIISALTGAAVKKSIAITGEITLRGELLKIGGLKEKLLAAMRSGVKLAIIPESNLVDLEEFAHLFKNKLEIRSFKWIDEVLSCMLVQSEKKSNIVHRSSSLEN